jgi:hypothetical protein
MANLTYTDNDLGNVVLSDPVYKDDVYAAAGAGTLAEGTILARDSVSKKLVDFVVGGATNENGIPKVVVNRDIVIAGAGDVSLRPIIGGKVRKERLVIVADGDASNVDAVVVDQLRDYGIEALSVTDVSVLDNR